ncbi:hypothetical protein CHCC15087_3425 [Bacillus licheniformis]|nr:hypothetical protein CHCC20344_0529 [Bacillus licheniformis]TWK93605.1 hypothetical protein CHCC20325_4514 [Bacillus licheniformis]TWL44806.1 hypothetical protein CHCC15543_3666 [Bacillus licheniformis]TWM25360.1 hypothetical protein CHCC15087_3425 [Bacillus licheniformis]TWM64994.1 hypothetical protein CHCC14810_1350 [Bacillus licheniformis]
MSRKRHIGAFLLEENIGKMVFVKNSEYLYNIICFTLKGEENHETTKTALRPIADAVICAHLLAASFCSSGGKS